MVGMESWDFAAPQRCVQTSGNITATNEEKLQVTKSTMAQLTQIYEKH
jgi:hypothetical protein